MNKLWDAVTAVSRVAVWLGGAMLLLAAFIVTAEVVLRKGLGAIFGTGFLFSGSDEISGYLFAVGTSWSMAYVMVTRGHVRIDALYTFLPRVLRSWLDLLALLAMAVFVGAMLERVFDLSWTNFIDNNRSNTNLRIPLAWAQLPWFAGLLLFYVAIVVAILRTFVSLVRGDLATASATAGISSHEEEIASELKTYGIEVHSEGKR
jgi:TRAP-type C4-dicarboxylate transport system permease small subunit